MKGGRWKVCMAGYYLAPEVLGDVLGLGVLERLFNGLMLKQRMWISFLLVQFDSIFFCLGFLVLYWFVSGHHS